MSWFTVEAGRTTCTVALARRLPAIAVLLTLLVGGGCAQASKSADTTTPTAASAPLQLVVIGDSIPFNSSDDCPNCTGFVDRYAKALGEASHRPVTTSNLSEHTGLTLPDLLTELPQFQSRLVAADAIIVGIAHNSTVLNAESICGAKFDEKTNKMSDWSKINSQCATRSATKYEDQYNQLYDRVSMLRKGKPTILLTINRYNDWIGWEDAHLTLDQQHRTSLVLDAWNEMICKAAKAHAFTCADIYHAFSGSDGSQPAGDLLAADYTHPSDKGNEKIANVLVSRGFTPLA